MNCFMTLRLTDAVGSRTRQTEFAEYRWGAYFSPLHGDFAVRKVQFGRHSDSARGS
jgi:hypothetical protein